MAVFGGGYLLAVLAGVALGVLIGGIRRLGETLEIYVNGLNSTPRVAFIPLIVLRFGLAAVAKIAGGKFLSFGRLINSGVVRLVHWNTPEMAEMAFFLPATEEKCYWRV